MFAQYVNSSGKWQIFNIVQVDIIDNLLLPDPEVQYRESFRKERNTELEIEGLEKSIGRNARW